MNNHAQRLTEIKARAEVRSCLCAREDVPFLLAQLEQASTELAVFRAKTHDEQLSAALKLVGVGNDRISRAAEMGLADAANAARIEVGFELRDLAKKLAASEAAAAQMRAALEECAPSIAVLSRDDRHAPSMRKQMANAERLLFAALAADAGKGWLSPEEAARQKAEIRKLHALRIEDGQEAERLRKELEQRETHHKELHNANEQLSASLTSADNRYYLLLDATEKGGLVSEEECARRCREVVRRWDDFCNPDMRISYVPETEAELLAIIDRVAKGGAR